MEVIMSATMHIQDCNMSPETWDAIRDIARVLVQDNPNLALDIHFNHVDPYLSQYMIQISGFQPAPVNPYSAQLLRSGLRQDHNMDRWYINSEDLVLSRTDSISGDQVEQPVKEVTSGVGLEIRDDLTKVFASSALDVQQLDIVVTRRSKDGVLVCNVCIEAIDNGD